MRNPVSALFGWVKAKFKFYGGITALLVYSISDYITNPKGRKIANRVWLLQIFFTANMAIKIIGLVALALGAVTVLQLFTQLSRFGALGLVGQILNLVIVRELGPIITAMIVISRSGTAIAAEIATMNINNEMDAIEMLGVDSLKMIVFPRVAGMVVSLVLLNLFFSGVGIIGGFVVGNLLGGITFDVFMSYVIKAITMTDIFAGTFKAMVFGFFISTISIFHGFQAFSSTQVPVVTTKAVVSSIFAMFLLDIIITIMFYMG
ncbi:MAG: ABC transporter permease [Brevinematales bacterium]|nr:ABC transporter permease [Brevinematales bacterium]